jgi:hypothetical protein
MSHWFYNNIPYDPIYEEIEAAGFVYIITNNINEMQYIGKKVFHARRTLPALKGKKRKRKVVKESDWRNYQSSCIELKKDIKKLGKENFIFEIVSFHNNRSENNYHETKLQFLLDVLEARDNKGERIFYNKNILQRYYPSAMYADERKETREDYLKRVPEKRLE